MVENRPGTRRERRIAARKAQILEAAIAIFREKGYGGATTRQIADAADVSEGTLYNYFKNKRDILLALTQDFIDETMAEIGDIQADGVESLLTQLLAERIRHVKRKRMFTLLIHEARRDPEILQYYLDNGASQIKKAVEERMQLLIDAGVMRPVNPAVVSRTLAGVMMGFAVQFELGGDEFLESISPEDLAAQIVDIILNGIRIPSTTGDESLLAGGSQRPAGIFPDGGAP